ALQSRLAENTFAKDGLVDYQHPVVRLSSLTQEDFLVLLHKIQNVFAGGKQDHHLLPDEALPAFMAHCQERIGEAYFRTPRTTITAFVNLLSVLQQNPGSDWKALVGEMPITADQDGGATATEDDAVPAGDDEFAKFKL
ncbi:MAG TPA: BREX system ATP-binding domain-containing protein, partial [Haloferula sp.]